MEQRAYYPFYPDKGRGRRRHTFVATPFSEWLGAWCAQHEHDVRTLAAALGCGEHSVWEWLRARSKPSAPRARALAYYTRTPLDTLLALIEEDPSVTVATAVPVPLRMPVSGAVTVEPRPQVAPAPPPPRKRRVFAPAPTAQEAESAVRASFAAHIAQQYPDLWQQWLAQHSDAMAAGYPNAIAQRLAAEGIADPARRVIPAEEGQQPAATQPTQEMQETQVTEAAGRVEV